MHKTVKSLECRISFVKLELVAYTASKVQAHAIRKMDPQIDCDITFLQDNIVQAWNIESTSDC